MAVVQTKDDKIAPGMSAVKDSDGYWYIPWVGGTRWYTGSGSPDGIITAPQGSIYIDKTAATTVEMWINIDSVTDWDEIGDVT